MIYRVIFKIGYTEGWFDFNDLEEAGIFAGSALQHSVPNEDRKTEPTFVTIKVIDPERLTKEDE